MDSKHDPQLRDGLMCFREVVSELQEKIKGLEDDLKRATEDTDGVVVASETGHDQLREKLGRCREFFSGLRNTLMGLKQDLIRATEDTEGVAAAPETELDQLHEERTHSRIVVSELEARVRWLEEKLERATATNTDGMAAEPGEDQESATEDTASVDIPQDIYEEWAKEVLDVAYVFSPVEEEKRRLKFVFSKIVAWARRKGGDGGAPPPPLVAGPH